MKKQEYRTVIPELRKSLFFFCCYSCSFRKDLRRKLIFLPMKTSKPVLNFFYQKFIRRDRSLFFNILSVYFLPLSAIYFSVIKIKKTLSRNRQFPFPVISVGNITAGGTGKTTVVRLLAQQFSRIGKTAIVTSGFGSTGKTLMQEAGFVSQHIKDFGDEAVLLSKSLQNTFIVKGRGKSKLIQMAASLNPEICIIDDGFHCYNVKKDLDIVVIDATCPFDNGLLIPSGLLREPVSSLNRARFIIINHCRMVDKEKLTNLISYLKKYKKRIFFMDYRADAIVGFEGTPLLPGCIAGKTILAFAGIGNPLSFFCLISKLGPEKIYCIVLPDHFEYTEQDCAKIKQFYSKIKPDIVLTTEKDAVKLRGRFTTPPVYFLKIEPVIENLPEAVMSVVVGAANLRKTRQRGINATATKKQSGQGNGKS